MWYYEIYARGIALSSAHHFTTAAQALVAGERHATESRVEPEAIYVSKGRPLADLSYDLFWKAHIK